MSKLTLLNDWFERVWVGGDLAAIPQFFTEDSRAAGVMRGLDLGPQEFAELIPALLSLIEDPSATVLRHIENRDWLWALLLVRAKSAETLEPIEFTAQVAMRYEGERIAEAYNHFDMISFFEQLGAFPPETMALCMSGERLH
ncbi:nuclear transport factor 2 family protein [Paenirhodobacter sp. CAU 1674]|uniref:nuclear transport factor 2 family protein n=1 Tax=Paenirhodobacter sp. CAU 1674 TaxID=3032596 RepID=UPI0023DB339C|nr:nuclear transport factor 2 family protein [Paenirhodobacter sp. CAU 1674]MDF2143126.1 nuclear transport factor 2 family protein [Paenirhodobacter sp. CAU 1674]